LGRALTSGLAALAVLVAPSAAGAAWSSSGSGGQAARAISLPGGNTPSASVSNRSVTVSWTATTLPGGAGAAGYEVRRYSTGGTLQSTGSGCSGTVTATSCTETAVPGGTWRYAVVPVQGNWKGSESSQSTAVTVASPALSLSPSSVSTLPATLTGSLSAYVPGQTVTFRLDNASSGTVLSGSISPSPVPSGGGASVSVTLPAGTSNGPHTVYAVGSSGDVASASVAVAGSTTITTSAWDVRDVSTGTSSNVSAQTAFAGDGRTLNTGLWAGSFSASRYIAFDSNTTLPAGKSITGATFNYRRAAAVVGTTDCFYLEVVRISTGAVIGTHGSAASPVGCVTGTSLATVSTPLPEITTSDLANDARVRVYSSSTLAAATTIDLATLSGSAAGTPFTLYTRNYIDAAAGGGATTYAWSQIATDGTELEAGANWATSFQATRYLEFKFPAYVPSGATLTGATLRHAYRSLSTGNTACWHADVYSGAALIAAYGSAASPVGCNTTTSAVTDSLAMPAVNTAARANDLTVRLYFRGTANGSNRRTRHDLTELSLTYSE
jgi:hypothetical protein